MKKLAVLLVCGLALAARPGRADLLDTILDISISTIDPSLKPARPVLRCILNGGSVSSCVTSGVSSQVKAQAQSNPNLMLIVNVTKAIQKHDWITVLDLAGTDLLFKLACAGGMPPAGPLKEFLCSSATSQLSKLAKPVLRSALEAVRDGNWPKLVVTIGPEIACSLPMIPDSVRIPACTGLDAVLKGSLVAFKAMLNELGNEVNGLLSLGNQLLGSNVQKLTPKQYFAAFWAGYLAKAVGLKMTHADPALSQLMFKLTYNCPGYYGGNSAPCDAMKTVFNKAVSQGVTAIQALEQPYYETHLKADLLSHYLYYVGSKGASTGGVGNCWQDLYHLHPLPSGDGDAEANPNPWENACKEVGSLLKSEIEKHKVALFVETESVLKKGCNITTNGTFYCPNYAGYGACLKILPKHPGSCILDESKAAQALGDEILQKLGAKRCAHPGAMPWEKAIVECTRPWKTFACDGMVASATPASIKNRVLCKEKPDAAFDQGKAKAAQVVQILNSGKVNVAVSGAAPSLLSAGKPYAFNPAKCRPLSPDPLEIKCQEWAVVNDVASKVPFVHLPPCPPVLVPDGVDAPCYSRTTLGRSR